ncbi:succinylglutamate desuccinylase/aspartoacylase family protein [Haloarcula halophila]|uniref:succinylglutamate desuccinylase/aspartoacylase family protein n=1 Tax=Haloarcula TaxID=2237 RepID=UPI0023E3738E|nr:succinylglutamate desuccinylase/aspartoacylase family protein [Halomicroarcula sp. DFY41]
MEHQPVTHTQTDRRLGRLPSGADLTVTVHRYTGGPGPTVYLQAAQHGIELNGPAVLRRLDERLDGAEIAGTVIAVPVANPPAFDHRSYTTPSAYDVVNPNLNRVWPGDGEGSLQERLAARLWGLAGNADAAVDLHTGTADMLEHVRYRADDEAARDLATAFGTEFVLADTDSEASAEGTFREAAANAGIPAVTAELGNSRQVSHDAIRTGVGGLVNVLRSLSVLPDTPASAPDRTTLRDDGETVRAQASGLFELRPGVDVGDYVPPGAELGTVYCPATFESLQTVTTDDGGVPYSLAREAVVAAGERVAAIATRAESDRR